MRSARPKLLHPCAGVPLLVHAVRAACALEADSVRVVIGPDDHGLQAALSEYPVEFAIQQAPRGTGDAAAAGCADLDGNGIVLVVNGDCPGVTPATLARLHDAADGAAAAVLAVRPDDRSGYGRLQYDDRGRLRAIVESSDTVGDEEAATDVNGGVYCFELTALRTALQRLDDDNAQGERYLTGVFALLAQEGADVRAVPHDDADEVHGVNSRAELARAERLLQRRAVDRLMEAGVTVRDPESTYVDVDVQVGADSTLHPGVVLEGVTTIGAGCELRAGVRVTDSRIGERVTVLDGSIIEDSQVDNDATLGPYARLRPGSDIGPGAKVGNFVETKATRLGAGSKASHLSYLGNAVIGDNVNIGAGTITCNYDGRAKHETVIGDGAFIGSNTALVAPVRIGKGAYVGAGSTITEDVPDRSLGLGRGRQVNKNGWADEKD